MTCLGLRDRSIVRAIGFILFGILILIHSKISLLVNPHNFSTWKINSYIIYDLRYMWVLLAIFVNLFLLTNRFKIINASLVTHVRLFLSLSFSPHKGLNHARSSRSQRLYTLATKKSTPFLKKVCIPN